MDPNTDNTELIEIISESSLSSIPWDPEVGEETRKVIENAPPQSQQSIQDQAIETLSRCVPPDHDSGKRTGIVVGHIQSGKTLSYTTVAALAHDNGYRLVIVLAGMTTELLNQTYRRLSDDLSTGPLHGNWQIFNTADKLPRNAEMNISNTLQEWEESGFHSSESVLITVMKNTHHLSEVTDLLSSLDLEGVPTLVIDDEADQASLNTKARSEEEEQSSIHSSILNIRSYLPHHTFLQYTATPQAPLLISLIDQLSPDFANILTPGNEYVGGHKFFSEYRDQLVRTIPEDETPGDLNARMAPPDSLIAALRNFFVGATASYINEDPETPQNRSMMIHPDRLTDTHEIYLEWVSMITEHWRNVLKGDHGEKDREELIEELHEEYNELRNKGAKVEGFNVNEKIPNFEEIVDQLPRVLVRTNIQPINQDSDGVEWNRSFAHVLVGGQKLGRGFTVEGLTVAYMPRGRGVGNADTIQQRARWFGYKQNYLGFCRVFLTADMAHAYRSYVEHEESMRRELKKHIDTGKPLTEWRRRFLLHRSLRATRRNVLAEDYQHGEFSDSWFRPHFPISQPASKNLRVVQSACENYEFHEDSGHEDRTPTQIHEVAENIPLNEVFDHLLSEFRYSSPRDTSHYLGLLLQLREYIDDASDDPNCTIYKMSGGSTRDRSMNRGGRIKNLFQGAAPGKHGEIYPGDLAIRRDHQVTIQIHNLNLYYGSVQGEPNATEIPVLAVWVPRSASRGFVTK
jgi:hypothetical protein